MRAFKAAGAVFASALIFLLFSGFSGELPTLDKAEKYIISESTVIDESLTVPIGARLVVTDGAVLTVANGAELLINGSLYIKEGAALQNDGITRLFPEGRLTAVGNFFQNGTLRASPDSTISLSGSLIAEKNAKTALAGRLTLLSKALLKLNGAVSISDTLSVGRGASAYFYSDNPVFGKTSDVIVSGSLTFADGSVPTFAGSLVVQPNATLYAYGGANISGSITVNTNANMYVGGAAELGEEGDMTLLGRLFLGGGDLSQYGKLTVKKGGSVSGGGTLKSGLLNSLINDGDISAPFGCIETVKNGITRFGGLILVNKKYSLPADYAPDVNQTAYRAYLDMYEEAKAAGFESMCILSSYRCYSYQQEVYSRWCDAYGEAVACTLSAKAGQSEHQTGLAFDISSLLTVYGETEEAKWLAANCEKYGFIIRYPSDKTEITEYIYEPWHIRYVGVNAARLIKKSGLCLEEFFGLVQ